MSLGQMFQNWISRTYSTLCACYEYCPPRAWLLLYYPLVHFEDVASMLLGPYTGRQYLGQATVFTIFPLFYFISKKYGLLETISFPQGRYMRRRKDQSRSVKDEKASSHEPTVPDHLLETRVEKGLTKDQVIARRKEYGPNEIWEGTNWRKCVWQFCADPAHVLLEVAVVLAVLHNNWLHLLPLGTLLILEFRAAVQDTRSADGVVDQIASNCSRPAVVVRDGGVAEIAGKDLVPGDIVHISEGSYVPADGRLISLDDELLANQSAITGENELIRKDHGHMCYMSTYVSRGSAFLVVTHTGKDTFVGRTISLVRGKQSGNFYARNADPRHVADFKTSLRRLGASILVAIMMPAVLGHFSGLWTVSSDRSIRLMIGMGIVAIRFLPSTSVKTYRALGASQLAKHGCILQSVEAAESLAGVDILCCDRTGTVTENRLTLLEPYCLSCDPTALILTASLCCTPDKSNLDPIQRAIMRALKQFPQARASANRYRVLDFQPFDDESRAIRALVQSPSGEQLLCTMGAPKPILELCLHGTTDEISMKDSYINAAKDHAHRGFRSLGVACKRENETWELLGLLPFYDPPRGDTVAALSLLRDFSTSFRLITGDATGTAKTFCESIGMNSTDVLDTNFMGEGPISATEQISSILTAGAYAEVVLETKTRILETLQNHGHLVAMTGDGAMEAPCLRDAGCGIAVAGATEAAQSASDVVFSKPGLWHIVQAIQISRQIFQQSHNYIVQRTVLLLNVFFIMLWHHFAYAEVFSLRLLLLTTQVGDLIVVICRTSCLTNSFSQQPARWSYRCLLREILPLAATTIVGSLVCMLTITDQAAYTSSISAHLNKSARKLSTIRGQASTLYVLVSDHLISCLIHTDGRFWAYSQDLTGFYYVLCFDLTIMVLCNLGLAGQNVQLSTATICWIWIVCLGTFIAAAASRYMTFKDRLIERPISHS